jgi:ElaB/YqjD/DUF883 family membrane-anchored ribosome-binding protein
MAEERDDLEVPSAGISAEGQSLETRDDGMLTRAPDTGLEASADDSDSDEAQQIREQIVETRAQMGETIDAIQDRLSFSNLSEQVSEQVNQAVVTARAAVYDATIGKASEIMKSLTNEISNSSFVAAAKKNPFPFVLIGAGVGLLAYQAYSGRGKSTDNRGRSSRGRENSLSEQYIGKLHAGDAVDASRNAISKASDTVSSTAGTVYNKVSDAVGSAYTGAGEAVSQAYNKVGELGSSAKDQYDHYLEENPLAVGAVALALGAAVGYAMPISSYEQKVLGPARQGLLDKAQNAASDLIDKGKEVVSEASKTVTKHPGSRLEH